MKFHEKLQNLRKNAGMTQLELAEKLMVSRQAISKWETGSAVPDLENIISICDLFGVSLDCLVRDTGTVETEEKIQDTAEKIVCREHKRKMKLKEKILLISAVISVVLLLGWKMNSISIAVIIIIWSGIGYVLYWNGRKLLELLSKSARKGEEN